MAPIVVNPFVNDYVTVQMRGAGVGLQGMGMTFGNILSTAILFTITLQMGEISKFLLLGGLNFVWITIIWGFGLIVEPSINQDKEARRLKKKSFCGKIRSELNQAWKACKQDKDICIGLIALLISRFGVDMSIINYLTWLTDLMPDASTSEVTYIWQ